MTTILVVGATGMTGRLLVQQLLDRGHTVRAIVRSPDKLPDDVANNPNLTLIKAAVLDLTDAQMKDQVNGCDAVVSCLGHVMNFAGMFGGPKKLCTDAARRLCAAIEQNDPPGPVRFILMNSVGVANPQCDARRPGFERALLFALRYGVPPHRDNETAAAHLYGNIGTDNRHIQWCSVRPDSLINADVSAYEICPSPTTGLFSGRPTARANVAHFMAELIDKQDLWNTWKFRTPVIMNASADMPDNKPDNEKDSEET